MFKKTFNLIQIMMICYILVIFLHYVSAQSNVQKYVLYVYGKNNESYRVDGYSSHKNYINSIEELLSDKIRDTYNFALQFSDSNPSVLLSRTSPEKLVFLQLLHSFDLKNTSFTNFLLNVAEYCDFSNPKGISNWMNANFRFPPDRIYNIIKYIATVNPLLQNTITEQVFFLNVNYKVFEKAVSIGDSDVIRWLLKHNVSNKYEVEYHLIEQSWKNGKIDVIKLLMEYGKINNKNLLQGIVNERYNNDETFLHIAARFGYVNSAGLLVTNLGANINAKDAHGKSPLYRAVEFDKHLVIDVLVSKGANIVDEPLLALAIQNGHIETVKKLINLGISLEIKDKNGDAPIFLAAKNNNVKILEILGNINQPRKIILNSTNDLGDTVMHVAASKGFIDSVKILASLGTAIDSKNYFGETPLYKSVESRNLDIFNFLIQSGADINKYTDVGNTVLHLAAALGNMEMVQLLLSSKFRFFINVRNFHGEIPIYKAAFSGHCEIAKYLVQKGGDLNSNNDGMTMLHDAATIGNEKAVNCLIGIGMNVDILGLRDATPLHTAISHGHEKIVQRLLEKKADPNSKTKTLWTPLHHAVLTNNINLIKLLMSNGADKTAKNVNGDTPYTLAINYNKNNVANEVRL